MSFPRPMMERSSKPPFTLECSVEDPLTEGKKKNLKKTEIAAAANFVFGISGQRRAELSRTVSDSTPITVFYP